MKMLKRRKALKLMLAAGGGVALFGGYEWYLLDKSSDIGYLDRKKELLAALAETIIPKTDTPGAKESGVGEFIYLMVKDCTDRRSQNKFIDGLKDLERYCSDRYKKNYLQLSAAEQNSVLQYFQQEGKPHAGIVGKAENKYLGRSFFTTLRDYTIKGYCTSEQGATKGLAYVAIPGRYNGCIPLTTRQRSWATK